MSLDLTQSKAHEKLSQLRCGALFMKMGTGKTKVAFDLVRSKLAHIDCLVWVAPASLLSSSNYQNELAKWNDLSCPVHFFSVDGISQSDRKYLELVKIVRSSRVFCVVDESITIKNVMAGRTKRLKALSHMFDFRLILNGTPLTKNLADLYAQMQFLSPKILNMKENEFARKFLIYKDSGHRPWAKWCKPSNEEALIEIIRPYIFDADLEINVNLVEHHIETNLTIEEQEYYDKFKQDFLSGKQEVEFLHVAQKFQQFYNKCSKKIDMIQKIVQTIIQKGEKVAIYCKFLSEVELLRDMFDCIVMTGQRKDDLSNLKKILVCTYGVGSFGLNLQMINHIIYFSQTFDFKDKEQSKHRAYRTGQQKDVHIYNLWVNTGLEGIMRMSLTKKQGILQNVEKIISKEKALQL